MQELDTLEQTYWSDPNRFADIMNVGMFHGKRILKAEMLSDEKELAKTTLKKSRNISTVRKFRDVAKRADFGSHFVLIGIENQSEIHYAIPIRIMGYDFLGYDEQLRQIRKEHKEKNDLQGAEYLSGFAKTDRLSPIFTLCVYWGEQPWDGPNSLYELLDWEKIPPEVRAMIADYPIHILDVRRFSESEQLQTDVRILFGFLQRQNDSEALSRYVEENKNDFSDIAEETYDLISVLANFEDLKSIKELNKNKDGDFNMCKAVEQWRSECMSAGLEQGISILVQDYLEEGFSKEKIISKLINKFSFSSEKAEEYFTRFSKLTCSEK